MKLEKIAIFIVLFLFVALFLMTQTDIRLGGDRGTVETPPASEERTTEERGSVSAPDPDRFPVVEGGLSSWKEVLAQAEKDTEFLRYLNGMTGLTIEDIRLLAKLESEGYSYSISLPKGTDIINSGRKDGVFFEKEGPLERERAALTELRGTPVILVSCGNPIRIKPQPKPEPKPPSPTVQPPSVRTDNAPWVSQTSADLAGFVDPKGTATTWFQWGRTTDLEGTPTVQKTVSSSQSVTARIGGLQPETKYYFRIVAKNKGGTSYGEIRTFMTDIVITEVPPQPPKPVVVTEPSVRTDNVPWVTQTSANLAGFVDPKGTRMDFWFEYGTTQSLGQTTWKTFIATSQSVNREITGLNAGTLYHFRVVAQERGGQVYRGDIRTFTTDHAPSQPPSQPDPEPIQTIEPVLQTKNVVSVTSNSANLLGFVDPKGKSIMIWFEYGEGTSLNMKTTELSVSSSGDYPGFAPDLKAATQYSFRIAARSDGQVHYGSIRSFTTNF